MTASDDAGTPREPTEYELLQSGASEIARKVLRGDWPALYQPDIETICKAWAWLAKEEILATQRIESLRAELQAANERAARAEQYVREFADYWRGRAESAEGVLQDLSSVEIWLDLGQFTFAKEANAAARFVCERIEARRALSQQGAEEGGAG